MRREVQPLTQGYYYHSSRHSASLSWPDEPASSFHGAISCTRVGPPPRRGGRPARQGRQRVVPQAGEGLLGRPEKVQTVSLFVSDASYDRVRLQPFSKWVNLSEQGALSIQPVQQA